MTWQRKWRISREYSTQTAQMLVFRQWEWSKAESREQKSFIPVGGGHTPICCLPTFPKVEKKNLSHMATGQETVGAVELNAGGDWLRTDMGNGGRATLAHVCMLAESSLLHKFSDVVYGMVRKIPLNHVLMAGSSEARYKEKVSKGKLLSREQEWSNGGQSKQKLSRLKEIPLSSGLRGESCAKP